MKIAFAFLLVGLSAFFASADANGLKAGRLTESQGDTLAALAVALIHKYELLKKIGKAFTCDQKCLTESAFMIIKIAAGFKKCSEEILINEVLDCLKIDVSLKVKEAFLKNDATTLMDTSVDVDKLYAALCCMMKKLYDADGLSFLTPLNGALSSMTPLLGNSVGDVAGVLSSALGVTFRLTGKIIILVEVEPRNLGADVGLVDGLANGVGGIVNN